MVTCGSHRRAARKGRTRIRKKKNRAPGVLPDHLSIGIWFGALGQRGDLNSIVRSYQNMFSHLQETEYRRHKASSACYGQKSIRAALPASRQNIDIIMPYVDVYARTRRTSKWCSRTWQNLGGWSLVTENARPEQTATTVRWEEDPSNSAATRPTFLGVHTGIQVRNSMRD